MNPAKPKTQSIPSEADFARAHAQMRESWRGVEAAKAIVEARFREVPELHSMYLLPGDARSYQLAIFLNRNKDLGPAKESGLIRQMVETVCEALSQTRQEAIHIDAIQVELDSNENVNKQFGGNYFNRMR